MVQVCVPQLGESITTAIVADWLKKENDVVKKDEPIAELETDKVTVEVPAPADGVISNFRHGVGEEVAVGDELCSISSSQQHVQSSTSSSDANQSPSEKEALFSSRGESDFDVFVIGAGPGGYSCAIRAAQLGFKVAIAEKNALGGTCLNVGCIPSKALLQASENYYELHHEFAQQGIEVSGARINLDKLQSHKRSIVEGNVSGIAYLLKKNSITLFEAEAHITAPHRVEVGGKSMSADAIIVATGSRSTDLPSVHIDEKKIVTSTGALDFHKVPKKLAVIGGGVIGVELGSVWRRLGADVTIIEFLPHLLGNMDKGIEKSFRKELRAQGFTIKTAHKVVASHEHGSTVALDIVSCEDDTKETESFDKVLVSVGRKAVSDHVGLDDIGVEKDQRGFVRVNNRYCTSVEGVYAIGDVIGGAMLAHKASEEGIAVAELLAGQSPVIDYQAIPSVVYTAPEIASVGATEETLKSQEIPYHVGKYPFKANGRARTMGMTEGYVKILAQPHSDRVLGVHIIGPCAGELIAEATMALEFGASSEDIARICHAHPTLSEVVREAALDVDNRATNI